MDTMEGKLPENVLLFTHLLRASGIKIGSDGVTDAISAIKTLGLKSKRAFYFSLLTCLTKKKEDEIIFRQAFDLFWQNPKFQEKTRNMLLPRTRVSEQDEQKEELAQRIRENLPKTEKIKKLDELEDNIIFDTSGSASDIQLNKSRDFGTMSKNELRQATDVIRNLSIHLPQKPFRRFEPRKMGPQLSVRLGLKEGAKNLGIVLPKFMRKKEKGRPIIFMIDISGSMENYSKMLIHFAHNLMQKRRNCFVFLFGTKLTNITNLLKNNYPFSSIYNQCSMFCHLKHCSHIHLFISSAFQIFFTCRFINKSNPAPNMERRFICSTSWQTFKNVKLWIA